jgi:hypothetical protein
MRHINEKKYIFSFSETIPKVSISNEEKNVFHISKALFRLSCKYLETQQNGNKMKPNNRTIDHNHSGT